MVSTTSLAKLAVPAVVLLIGLLSYTSQYLFYTIEPGPLDSRQTKIFNLLVICLWISYARACTTSPGSVPKDWSPDSNPEDEPVSDGKAQSRQRYCRKCDALKPPRSHHCKICKRYVARKGRLRRPRLTAPSKMHSQNGPSLSVDLQLCIPLHLSPFHALSVVRRIRNGLP